MSEDKPIKKLGKFSKAIHSGGLDNPIYGEVSPPIFQSATFSFPSVAAGADRFSGKTEGFIYSRLKNPTTLALEELLAALENGGRALTAATGMAAIGTMFLTALDAGSHVVATDALYGYSRLALENHLSRFGVRTTFVDTSDLDALEQAMEPETRLVFVETPTNPTMILTDIDAVARLAHRRGALLAVDNTFASPYLQRPLDLGADIVAHSLTKYINGHSDVVGGALVVNSDAIYQRLKTVMTTFGPVMDPHQAWLILRGARTLPLRMEKAQDNAMKLAEFLNRHPRVTWTRYPGLTSHPQHGLAKKQMDGFGAMLCFGVQGGLEGGKTLLDNVRLITLAVSLGGVESLIEHPASMTHLAVPVDERVASGITDDLVRLSVGCEDFEDLRDDLDRALHKIG